MPVAWLRALTDEYEAALPDRLAALDGLVEHAIGGSGDPERVRTLLHAVDRLAGSAGSYGFQAVTEALRPALQALLAASRAGCLSGEQAATVRGALVAARTLASAPRTADMPRAGVVRLMVVDADAAVRAAVRAGLDARFTFEEHGDGAQALDAMRRAAPDVLLVAVRLPGRDGTAVLRAVRADPRLEHLPVIALTTLAQPGDRDRLMAAGFDGLVTKPEVDGPSVRAAVEACLAR